MSVFKLDRAIWNPSLYNNIRTVWFEGVPLPAKELDMKILQRWFQAPPEERAKFDQKCRDNFATALESIGPSKLKNPEDATPFLGEIQQAVQQDPADGGAEAAWTALCIVLLVDQLARNIYRTNEGLRLVYNHYDKIAYSLLTALSDGSKGPIGRPDKHPQWKRSPAHRMWFYLPFEHQESLETHDTVDEILKSMENDLGEVGESDVRTQVIQAGLRTAKEHRDILERFGRYPHRNGALGRESTKEETQFLAEGGATFGVSQDK
ncbi:hypothetical protein BDV96DRAFT_615836 [Lophiotrema nucula]|uniref:DUF924-domain-containing protein n=1 Tax=Lophiotrema nucula TaxID=690887 RepID=A0A6A5YR12_9PLEO|nr:hypothetical protein BDV96DRAFT_615836 [Lophiotrema nucula]